MNEIILDALIDSLKLLPFLLIVYFLIEILERKAGGHFPKLLNSKMSVFVGAGLGLLPQCGFSVVSTKLYAKRLIPIGTLIAIYISTSDEAIAILISSPAKLFPLLAIKFVFALALGLIINLIIKTKTVDDFSNVDCSFGCHNHEIGNCDNEHHKHGIFKSYIFHPLTHTLTVFVFIFIVNLVFGTIIHFIGEDSFNAFMNSNGALQPLLAALIGLIPNCASSVAISQMYAISSLNLGAAVAGLSVNAGVAYILLIKSEKIKAVYIIGSIFIISVLLGTLIYFLEVII